MSYVCYLYQAKENLEVGLQDILEKIEKLEWFVSQVSSYFTDSLEVLRLAIQGATQLSQVLVDSDGSYYTEGLDMNWVVGMKNQPLKSHTLTPGIPVTKAEKAKRLIIDDFKNSYGLDEETALALYNLQQGILERAEREGWSNEQVIYEYNRLVASFAPDNFVSIRWKAIVGTVNVDDRDRICRLYGLDTEEIDILSRKLIEQHKKEDISRDLVHETVQLASFTEQSWGFNLPSAVHLISTIANTGSVHIGTTTARIPVPMEQYEISFKGDIDSGRYGDRDFNSDLDPINSYYLMKEADVKDIFTVQADYNRKIDANELNRVQEFYGVIGDGDVDKGKRLVEFIVRDDSSFGHQFITWGQSKEEKRQHQDAFMDYLERGGETNVE
ncbi:ATP-binding protein [Streptococcus suis]